ncbi:hypothetical protein KVF89_27155 [Nocardioides carbamazepini]|uniref:hypothetical protein n=1 Tax=Nocardioides carbamazepini TaxID=2854259 RepID=UPI002149FBBD|nr:hypothetical protein [Nocardioides carbamazepini]MCR1786240.1 hypothetical protein [Nocardioides carbamazepini]
MSADAPDMVSIPRADLEALQAELRRLRQREGDRLAVTRMNADSEPSPDEPGRVFTRTDLAQAWGISG